eukprot:CAMPEP_0197891802 /NCGR_PEP_ID=MMETSP1439-20131203/29763_1 /TAXON_ID=66791 /ORGANISM="Gonyaulax spinifera, Strain CCMP409" /LENGTH=117 /DNA_ID=CAMNT_0043511935 /DNA_START=67 /DNA_END=418 /DNA_ORIENTATION=-
MTSGMAREALVMFILALLEVVVVGQDESQPRGQRLGKVMRVLPLLAGVLVIAAAAPAGATGTTAGLAPPGPEEPLPGRAGGAVLHFPQRRCRSRREVADSACEDGGARGPGPAVRFE